ncbi:MAG: hypothetical protein S4CHLAM37_03860 [Chlamydiia bacterium]|nr:hypothetical protein [Chlamydiia bacterium]
MRVMMYLILFSKRKWHKKVDKIKLIEGTLIQGFLLVEIKKAQDENLEPFAIYECFLVYAVFFLASIIVRMCFSSSTVASANFLIPSASFSLAIGS